MAPEEIDWYNKICPLKQFDLFCDGTKTTLNSRLACASQCPFWLYACKVTIRISESIIATFKRRKVDAEYHTDKKFATTITTENMLLNWMTRKATCSWRNKCKSLVHNKQLSHYGILTGTTYDTRASFVVIKQIAKMLKLYSEGRCVKEPCCRSRVARAKQSKSVPKC